MNFLLINGRGTHKKLCGYSYVNMIKVFGEGRACIPVGRKA